MFRRLQFTFTEGALLYLVQSKTYQHYKSSIFAFNIENFLSVQGTQIAPSGNVMLKLLEHACKIFSIIRNYVLSVFSQREKNYVLKLSTKKVHLSNKFLQHHWQECLDGDSLISQSKFDAYAS